MMEVEQVTKTSFFLLSFDMRDHGAFILLISFLVYEPVHIWNILILFSLNLKFIIMECYQKVQHNVQQLHCNIGWNVE
jgi:hypothetical protein